MKTPSFIRRSLRFLNEFFFGAFTFELYRETLILSKTYASAIDLLLLGEFLGLPLLPNFYGLKLLPYLVGRKERFKHKYLKEKDTLELLGESGAH